MATTTKTKPISQAEMARHTARLDRAYREELADQLRSRTDQRFTIDDMSILTGWAKTYFFRLERDGRIPRAKRVGTRRVHQWSEEQARTIMAFAKRFG